MRLRDDAFKSAQVLREEGPRTLFRKIRGRLRRDSDTSLPSTDAPLIDVLFVNGCDQSVPHPTRYRVHHQMEQLGFWGMKCREVFYIDAKPEDVDSAQAVILFRCPITDAIDQMIIRAHEQDKQVLFDVDDLVIDTSYTDGLPVVQAMTEEEKALFDDGVMRIGRTLALCDGAIVSTERLKAELSKVVPKVFVNRNVASMEMLACSQAALAAKEGTRNGTVRIGYFSGSMTHNEDFEQVLPALTKVMDECPEVVLVVMGDLMLPEPLQQFAERVIALPKVDWRELPSAIASVDICIAPIKGTIFNEAKSENKWTESSLVKVPVVASDVGAFHDAIEDGITGLLCKDEVEWREAILALVGDPALRACMGQRAYDQCMRNGVTATTGYKLALWLSGKRHTIEEIVPDEVDAREFWIHVFSAGVDALEGEPLMVNDPWEQVDIATRVEAVHNAREAGKNVALFVYERLCGDSATFRYFGYNVVQRLAVSRDWDGQYFFIDELEELLSVLPEAACLVVVRGRFRPEFVTLSEKASEHSVPIAYAMDDDAMGVSMAPRVIEAMTTDADNEFERDFWTGVTRRFELASSLTDCFLASSSFFASLLHERYQKPAFVVRQSLNDEQIAISEFALKKKRSIGADEAAPFTLGYFSGTASHQQDFALIEEAVINHLDAHDDSRLLIVGCFELSDALYELLCKGKVAVLPKVGYAMLQVLQASVDVVLAPLVLDEFANCKGALKVFEAGAVGTPACASPSYCYREAIDQGVSGFLCETAEDWAEALEVLHDDEVLRESMGRAAYALAMGRYSGDAMLREIECALDGVVSSVILERAEGVLSILEEFDQVQDWDDPFTVNPLFAR